MDDVAKWKKRIIAKRGPFYLLDVEVRNGKNNYHVAWREKHRHGHMVAKLGYFKDGMYCRYGISTYCTLAGETPFDFQHGSCDHGDFKFLVNVYNEKVDDLKIFDLDTLEDLKH